MSSATAQIPPTPAGAGSSGLSSAALTALSASQGTTATAQITGFKTHTGTLVSNGLTNEIQPTVLGTGTVGTTVSVIVDGRKLGTAVVNTKGDWQFTVPTPLMQGTHRFQASAGGSDSRATSLGPIVSLTIDTVPPTVTLIAPDFADYQTPVLKVIGSDNYGLAPTVYIDVDLKHDGSFSDPGDEGYATGTFNGSIADVPILKTLSYGTYSLRAGWWTSRAMSAPAPSRP